MTAIGWAQIIVYFLLILALTKPMGSYMFRVFKGERTLLTPVFGPVERFVYRAGGVQPEEDMKWTTYTVAMLLFSVVGIVITYAILRWQAFLPLNPEHLGSSQAPSWGTAMTPDLAFNTSVSFATNTNWQSYGGENTMSYFSQMVGLASHNFFSAATGIAIAIALVRGLARKSATSIGNFWVDATRAILYVLIPVCVVITLAYVWQGMPMNFHGYTRAHTLEGPTQIIAQGPVASQEAIKILGTNGGGLFNANSAHPFENPTPLTNFLQLLSIFLIGAGIVYTFGLYVGNTKQGWAIFGAMSALFLIGVIGRLHSGSQGKPLDLVYGCSTKRTVLGDSGGNMEGKEVRFGEAQSTLFATVTTDASCGAVNSMHDSLHAHWRPGADGQHPFRRSHIRRGGGRLVRHVDVRGSGGVHRRAYGWPYARIPWEKGGMVRGEDGDACGVGAGRRRAGIHRTFQRDARAAPGSLLEHVRNSGGG